MTDDSEIDDSTVDAFEASVADQLGFYPSYLAAVDQYRGAAPLAWHETHHLLRSTRSRQSAHRLAADASGTIARSLPTDVADTLDRATFDETAVRDAVRFFSFVVLRVGIGITACRYAVDGDATRLAHQERIDPAMVRRSEPPKLMREGLRTTLPVDPPRTMVDPENAPEPVAGTYRHIRRELDTPNVNYVFRAFAVDPDFLDAVVDAQVAASHVEPALSRQLIGQYARALEDGPNRIPFRSMLVHLEERDVESIARELRTYHENLPTLLLTVYLGARFASP